MMTSDSVKAGSGCKIEAGSFIIVAKFVVFGIECKTAGSNQIHFFVSAHHRKNEFTHPTVRSACSGTDGSIIKKILRRKNDGSLLCEMQSQKRNEKPQRNKDEKRAAGHPGCMPDLRH